MFLGLTCTHTHTHAHTHTNAQIQCKNIKMFLLCSVVTELFLVICAKDLIGYNAPLEQHHLFLALHQICLAKPCSTSSFPPQPITRQNPAVLMQQKGSKRERERERER
ncbi:unnamed protein product [Boreogadus saida]